MEKLKLTFQEFMDEGEECKKSQKQEKEDDFLCNFISKLYIEILYDLRDKYNVQIYNWDDLEIYKKRNPQLNINFMIDKIIESYGINKTEWQSIIEFKNRNLSQKTTNNALIIILERTSQESKDLTNGLIKILNTNDFIK